MSDTPTATALARGWIEAWIRMDIAWLNTHLTDDFKHTSPFGELEGKGFYLDTVIPMAQKSVQKLVIINVTGEDSQAAIWFENHTPQGVIPSCDWIEAEHGRIKSIQSFYDSSKVREVLDDDEQSRLGS